MIDSISPIVPESGIFVYMIKLPPGINEMVTVCNEGYVIYIDSEQSDNKKLDSYNHALFHIRNNDFEKTDVDQIEYTAHKEVMSW